MPSPERRNAYNRSAVARNKLLVKQHLEANPCVDCGESRLPTLQFDHRDPSEKYETISRLRQRPTSVETLLAEIAKCDVVCANCHSMRTSEQYGWYDGIDDPDPYEPSFPEREHGTLRMYKYGCKCTPCREANTAYHREYRRSRATKR